MNKLELIAAAAKKAEASKAEVAKILDAVLESAAEAIKKGEKVQLVGYMTIAAAHKAARKAKTRAPVPSSTSLQRRLFALNRVQNLLSNQAM